MNVGTRKPRYKAEKQFAKFLDSKGKRWQYEPKRFQVYWSKYTPDFYVAKEDAYYEVMSTRQRFQSAKYKIGAFLNLYPSINLQIVRPNGESYLLPDNRAIARKEAIRPVTANYFGQKCVDVKLPLRLWKLLRKLADEERRQGMTAYYVEKAVSRYLKSRNIILKSRNT